MARTPQIASKIIIRMIPRLVPATVFAIIAAMARSITTNHPICSVGSCILTPYLYNTNAIVSGLVGIVNTPLYRVLFHYG